ncbi:hypothetical protein [Streptomyces sp. NPDC019224]|uniref:hypothetical protein n=1 Tax=Streptomyces sp. NPDC019224 TaxID=3154484 RepID=UPI0033D5B41C
MPAGLLAGVVPGTAAPAAEVAERTGPGRTEAGRETTGRETAGWETAGWETAGRETTGRETTGRETTGREATGREATGRARLLVQQRTGCKPTEKVSEPFADAGRLAAHR